MQRAFEAETSHDSDKMTTHNGPQTHRKHFHKPLLLDGALLSTHPRLLPRSLARSSAERPADHDPRARLEAVHLHEHVVAAAAEAPGAALAFDETSRKKMKSNGFDKIRRN